MGRNPIRLGILMTVNMAVGLCHPPVGRNLYAVSGIAPDGHHRAHRRGLAVAAHHVGISRRGNRWVGIVALAAARLGDVVLMLFEMNNRK